jgi:uncharacterized protein YegP (UPF0339 family)
MKERDVLQNPRIELSISKTMKPKWIFKVRARNAEVLAQSRKYTRKTDCIKGAKRLREAMKIARIVGVEDETAGCTHLRDLED